MHVTYFWQGGKAQPGCTPPYYRDKQWALHTPVVFDAVPSGKKFGDVNTDANSSYKLVGLDVWKIFLIVILLLWTCHAEWVSGCGILGW
jgi:hypothetical protein